MAKTGVQLTGGEEVQGILPVANGGTGAATQTLNYVLLGNGTGAFQTIAPGTAGFILSSDGTTWSSQPLTRMNSVASSATPAINTDTTDQFNITALAVAITSMSAAGDTPAGNLTGTPRDGQHLMIRIKDNGTARAITWGPKFLSSGVATLLATTVISKTHLVGLIYDSAAAKWVCVAVDATGY